MTHIGIMQGRLVPPTDNRIQCFPRERWADEFALAAKAGLDCIEWIYDLYGADVNPLATDAEWNSSSIFLNKTKLRFFPSVQIILWISLSCGPARWNWMTVSILYSGCWVGVV